MKNSKKNINFEELEKKYDPQLSFRILGPKIDIVIISLLVSMSVYHFWASGFGLVREVLHRGIHISFVIGFILFRFFDITKPFPINWVDIEVGGGIGIMLDDIIAALPPIIIINIGYIIFYAN